MKNVLIIHGAYGNPTENWIPWLSKRLEENGFKVIVPSFPTPEKQNLENWDNVIQQHITDLNEESILIGHSIGAVFLLSVLEELKIPAANAIFISGFLHNLGDKNFDEINKTFYNKDFDWKKIRNSVKKISVIHGSNDPYVPTEEAKFFAEKIGEPLKIIENGGHFNKASGFVQFPELLDLLLK